MSAGTSGSLHGRRQRDALFLSAGSPTKHLDEYESRFTHCAGEKVKGEISTSYLSGDNVPERIYSLFPDVKIVVSLRDPVERTLSHIRHLQSKGKLSANVSVQQAVKQKPEAIENSLYGKYLKRFFATFSRDQIHIVLFSEIQKNPQDVVANLYQFLEVDTLLRPDILHRRYNTSGARSSELFWWTNKIYLYLKQSKPGRMLINILRKIGVRTTIIERLARVFTTDRKQTIQDAGKTMLQRRFQEDISKLTDYVEKDLSSWQK